MCKDKKDRGITLVALVITIVLLILSGVAISALSGDNRHIKKSGRSKRTK